MTIDPQNQKTIDSAERHRLIAHIKNGMRRDGTFRAKIEGTDDEVMLFIDLNDKLVLSVGGGWWYIDVV